MRLRTLDCKNCATPLRQEGDKLVCRSCGSIFDIPKDANDIEYDRIVNAEDYIRLSLAKSILNLETNYNTQFQQNEQKRAENRRASRKRMTGALIKSVVIVGVLLTIFFAITMAILASNDKKENKVHETEAASWNPGYRITPSDLKADKKFRDYLENGIIKDERAGYDELGSVIFSSDEIWGVNKDPEILGRYLVTEEDWNALYVVFKVTYETGDGRTREMYDCRAFYKLTMDMNGDIVYDRDGGESTDEYDFRFHAEPELDPLMEQYIYGDPSDRQRYLFEF